MSDLSQEILDTIARFHTEEKKEINHRGWEYTRLEGVDSETGKIVNVWMPTAFIPRQPPVDLETRFNLTNISQQYQMPDGVSAANLELYENIQRTFASIGRISAATCQEKFLRVVTALMDKNPSLKQIKFDCRATEDLTDIIVGVTSAFRATDIAFYISLRTPEGKQLLQDTNYEAISQALKDLEVAGVLVKTVIKLKPLHIEYSLSEK